MRQKTTFSLVLIISLLLLFIESGNAQYAIPQSVLGSGGSSISSTDNKIVGTLGQPFIGNTGNTSYSHSAGFWWEVLRLFTGIEENPHELADYRIEQNYPNPFNQSTTILYDITHTSHIKIIVYDMLMREVRTLVDEEKAAGSYIVNFDATGLPNGIYTYCIMAENYTKARKMIVMK
ncbi:MAG: T9SS type A sorting domain-containing protein [Ignavibacteriae bacterium]|nr:T9SS type A sorting domain-containing protein [Ignavibacteriota bacterium]